MTPLNTVQTNSGRLVLVLAIALLTGWALSLIHQSQEYVPDTIPKPNIDDLIARRAQLEHYKTQSLPELFLRELGVTTRWLDPTGCGELGPTEVAMVLQPSVQAPRKLEEQLRHHVRKGGRLVVFTRTDLDLLHVFGVEAVGSMNAGGVFEPVRLCGPSSATVETMHVRRVDGPADCHVVTTGVRPLVPLLETSDRKTLAGMVGFGAGSVTIVTADVTAFKTIESEDNPLFFANLVLGETAAGRCKRLGTDAPVDLGEIRRPSDVPVIRVLDFDAEVLRRLYGIDAEIARRYQEARRRWKYDSLWSLIKANPVSAGLIQLVLGLVVFVLLRARRLGPPIPERVGVSSLPDPIAARSSWIENENLFRPAISRAGLHLRRWIARRLGLGGATAPGVEGAAPSPEEIRQALAGVSPKARKLFDDLIQFMTRACSGQGHVEATHLARTWRMIDEIRGELERS